MRRAMLGLAALLLWLSAAGSASAHANLARSTPQAGASLRDAPAEILLEFTEELDPGFTRMQLYDSRNQLVNPGPGAIDPSNARLLRLVLAALPQDSYTVLWRVRSAVDGHVTEGSVPFGVGVAANTAALIPPRGAVDPATSAPPWLDSLLRWLSFVAAALTFGAAAFGLLVWRRAWRPARDQHAAADLRVAGLIRRQSLLGALLLVVVTLLFLLEQAAIAADVPLPQALGDPLLQLLGSRNGLWALARIVLALLAVALAWRLPSAGASERRGYAGWWLVLALGGLALWTISLNSHAAALPEGAWLAIALDWLHLAAMVVWLGGLPLLLALILDARRAPAEALPLAPLIPRFSQVAVLCVATLAITGVGSYLLHIGSLSLLVATTYGRFLLVKLALFALLVALAALNLLRYSPRLRGEGSQPARLFARSVRGELVTGALVLLAAGVMTSVAPSKAAWEAHLQLGPILEAEPSGVPVILRIAPGKVGDNEFAVDIEDPRPGAQSTPAELLARFTMLEMEMAPLEVPLPTQDGLRYSARGNFLSMQGLWQIELVLRRPGFDDVRHTFALDVEQSPLDDLARAPAPSPGLLARARATFANNCLPCHGVAGKGDGPAARSLNPRPADLTAPHVDDHTDKIIYDWISSGFPGSAMPAFAKTLTQDQIWELVTYVRDLRAQAK